MSRQEKLLPSSFYFPRGMDGELLNRLVERLAKSGSLRITIAHQIEEEGLVLRGATEKLRPHDEERKMAAEEYTSVGTLVLETVDAEWSGQYEGDKFEKILARAQSSQRCRLLEEKKQVELLKENRRGFSLLKWWVERGLKELSMPETQAALMGRINGVRRYQELYQALVGRGLPLDK